MFTFKALTSSFMICEGARGSDSHTLKPTHAPPVVRSNVPSLSYSQKALSSNVFVTGSLALLPGLKERLEADLRQMRPAGSHFRVRIARRPDLDAW